MAADAPAGQAGWVASVPMPLRSVLAVRRSDPGDAMVELSVRPWMGSTLAAAAILADDVLGLAATTKLPLGYLSLTAELTVDAVGPLGQGMPASLLAGARAVAIDSEAGTVTTSGTIEDGSGASLVLISARSVIVERASGADPVEGASTDAREPEETSVPSRALPYFSNPMQRVHGGVLAAIGATAAERALAPLPLTGLRIFFARPAPVDGKEIEAATDVLYSGRRSALARVSVGSRPGAVSALVTASAVGETTDPQGGTDE